MSPHSRTARPAALALGLLVLAACGGGGPDVAGAAPGSPATDDPGAELVLQVQHVGGFVTPTMLATRLPVVSVYDDGRVITQGPQIAIFPGPALPNVLVRQVDDGGVERLVDLALEAGVGEDRDLGRPPVADVPTTRFTVVTEESTRRTDVEALGAFDMAPSEGVEPASGPAPETGLSPEALAARAELNALLSALTDLEATLGAEAVGPEQPYEPEALAVVATPWVDPGADLGAQPEVPWPGPALPGESMAEGLDLSCVTVTAPELGDVLAAAESATSATPWTSGGQRWSLAFRPLLPHESGCADLRGQA